MILTNEDIHFFHKSIVDYHVSKKESVENATSLANSALITLVNTTPNKASDTLVLQKYYGKKEKHSVTLQEALNVEQIENCFGVSRQVRYGQSENSGFYFFSKMNHELFNFLHRRFLAKGLDLTNLFQKSVFLSKRSYYQHKSLGENSTQYLNQILKHKYDFKKHISVFKDTVESVVFNNIKSLQGMSMNLLSIAVKENLGQDFILKNLKTFLDNNKTLTPAAFKTLEFIKGEVENWDLDKYFTLAEKKMLYGNESGLVSKEAKSLFYEADLNVIRNKTKTTLGIISGNMNNFLSQLPVVLGNNENYMGMNSVHEAPLLKVTISFEKTVLDRDLDNINKVFKLVLEKTTLITKDEMKKMLEVTLFANELDDSLDKKITTVRRQKI